MRYLRIIVACGLAVAMLAPPASADVVSHRDPDDTGGFLDFALARHGHSETGVLRHRLVMHDAWKSRQLKERAYLTVLFRIPDQPSRFVEVVYEDGRLKARMYERRDRETHFVGRVGVRRRDSKTVVVSFRPRMLGSGVDVYRWEAASTTHDPPIPPTGTEPHGDPKMHNDEIGPIRHVLR